ncbi:MAG TPA: methyltransferase [Ruminococcaceae bacterium]|jgi:regulator of RNase E activity RraA|nr:methyltransferase [Oscillospiraceae bacterium]
MSVGNRIFLERDLPDEKVMEGFQKLPAANVADTMGRSCALNSQIRLISSPKKPAMVGAALTVKARPGDNLMLHKALDLAGSNDVIIVSNDGDRTHSLMGEIMAVYAQCTRKVGGIVLDGPIRDIDELSQMDMFLYATGSTPGGPYKEGPGEINVPISIGNIAVMPGDIVLGDRDGVIVIPRKDAAQILEAAAKYAEMDAGKVAAAKNGAAKRQWVDETLEKKKVEIIQGKFIR